MNTYKAVVKLPTVEDVKRFVSMTQNVMGDVDLVSGKYVVDAKSIMGIFSMNLSKPIELVYNGTNKEEVAEIVKIFGV